jgi:2-phospho-L-lactate guanylyltransferase (CobY/MobA/RfbA family)
LESNDVLALLQHAVNPPVVVIAPDRRHEGTNALLLAPSNLIEYDFGINSFQRHCDRARRAGARLEVVDLPSLGLDLDLPEDLESVRKKQGLNLISKQ